MPKLKILWSSVTPTIESGYGRVTREIVSRLVKKGYDIMLHGYQSAGRLHTVDKVFRMLDAGGAEYGMNVLEKYFKKYNRDILITLFDIWPFFGKVEKLQIPWIPYIPIDAEPVTTPMSEPLKFAYKRITFSKFGDQELRKVGLNSSVIYHGVDTKVYKPFSEKEREKARKGIGLDKETFLVGSNGANQWDRKDFPRMIRIFAEFVKQNNATNALLYLHANPGGMEGKAYSLVELAKLYKIEKQVRFSNEKNVLYDTGLAKMYNTFDVYISTSRAEGCGLPILEAQACGVPAIVPDNSAQPEWVKGHGWVVPCYDHIVALTTPQHNKWYLMDVQGAVEALTEAYQNSTLRKKYGKMAREEMKKYDWDKIVKEQWIPYLKSLEKEMASKEIKVFAEGHTFNIRKDKMDLPVIFEVIHNDCYSKFIHLEADDVWLDIGGHIGTFAIDIADKVRQVCSFEPIKENFDLFIKNVRDNKIGNVLAVNKAVVGNDDKERKFFMDGGMNTGGHSFIGAENKIEVKVSCENINNILQYSQVNKIKMDCEGSEYEILKAMDFTHIKEIVLEYHFNLLGMTKYEELLELLRKDFIVVIPSIINSVGQCIIYAKKKPEEVGSGNK
jgi:FkbM family methyltransferase